jgi:hypothetical protein
MMDDDLGRDVYVLSSQAFELAKASAGGAGTPAAKQSAREMNERLDQLWLRIDASPPDDPGVTRAWSDARLDVGYVLSAGELAPSPRLAAFLAEGNR